MLDSSPPATFLDPCNEGKRHSLCQTGHGRLGMRLRRANQPLRCGKRPSLGGRALCKWSWMDIFTARPSHVDQKVGETIGAAGSLGCVVSRTPPQGCMMTDPDGGSLGRLPAGAQTHDRRLLHVTTALGSGRGGRGEAFCAPPASNGPIHASEPCPNPWLMMKSVARGDLGPRPPVQP